MVPQMWRSLADHQHLHAVRAVSTMSISRCKRSLLCFLEGGLTIGLAIRAPTYEEENLLVLSNVCNLSIS